MGDLLMESELTQICRRLDRIEQQLNVFIKQMLPAEQWKEFLEQLSEGGKKQHG